MAYGVTGVTANHMFRLDLALKYVNDDSVRVALRQFESDNPPLIRQSPPVKMLEEATKTDPQGVWREAAPWLMGERKAEGSMALHLALMGWYGKFVGAEVLVPWARENLPHGPRIAATLAAVQTAALGAVEEGEDPDTVLQPHPLDPLTRELLINFDGDPSVGRTLAANFTNGTFFGNFSQWLQMTIVPTRRASSGPPRSLLTFSRRAVGLASGRFLNDLTIFADHHRGRRPQRNM